MNGILPIQSEPLRSGFVRIKTEENKEQAEFYLINERFEITLPTKTTSDDLISQLFQLGILALDNDQIKNIAAQNGNETFEPDELEALDKYLEASLPNDKKFFLEIVKQNGLALRYANKSLRSDKEVVLAALKQNPDAYKYADKSLKEDKDISDMLGEWRAKQYFNAWHTARNSHFPIQRGMYMGDIRYKIEQERKLGELNIDYAERFFYPGTAQEIIYNRNHLEEPDSRPLAVLIFAKVDGPGAFEYNPIKNLIWHGYRVVYFEAETEEDVFNSLKAATSAVKKKASLLVLAGHGARTTINFGDQNYKKNEENENLYIDLSDKEEMQERNLSECLEDQSVIVLDSCSTGAGAEKHANVANLFKSVFFNAKIFSSPWPVESVRTRYLYGEQERVTGAIFPLGTYSIIPLLPKEYPSNKATN